MSETEDVRVLLVERAGCHLCADAHAVLDAVAARTGERWASVDVDSSPELLETYGELVPVALVDGRECGHWRLDPGVIEAELRRS
ncbi:glutaredoxin family protein [Salana multivorans]